MTTKTTQENTTNSSAEFGVITPLGISLTLAVLGFFKSISLSIYLLNAMAAERAKTIQTNTRNRVVALKPN